MTHEKLPLVIYHAACDDGFGAALAAWLTLGDEAIYVEKHYYAPDLETDEHLNAEFLSGREVYVLDFSFSAAVMEHILVNSAKLIWLDHHASAFKNWCGRDYLTPARQVYRCNSFPIVGTEFEARECEIVLDNRHSGAMLAWQYFNPGCEAPLLFQHIQDRDLWQFKLHGTRGISLALRALYDRTFVQWEELMEADNYGSMWSSGMTLELAQDRRIAKIINGSLRSVLLNRIGEEVPEAGLAVNAVTDISETGNAIAKVSGTYSLSFFVKDNTAHCSLRSIGDYDVTGIAEYYGGGGHRNASGFSMEIGAFIKQIWNSVEDAV